MRALAVLLSLSMAGCGGQRTNGAEVADGGDLQIVVTYECEVGHKHREAVEAWADSRGVLMPATEAGSQIECLTAAETVEIR